MMPTEREVRRGWCEEDRDAWAHRGQESPCPDRPASCPCARKPCKQRRASRWSREPAMAAGNPEDHGRGSSRKGPFQGRAGQPQGAEQEAGIQLRPNAGGTVHPPRLSLPATELKPRAQEPPAHQPQVPWPHAAGPPLQHLIPNMRRASPGWKPGRGSSQDGTGRHVDPGPGEAGSGTAANRSPGSGWSRGGDATAVLWLRPGLGL